jgi:polar amino acid transport system permease protein
MREFNFLEVITSLLLATQWTIVLSLIAFTGGGALGLLLTMMRISKNRAFQGVSRFFIAFVQGTPLLMQLFIVFFGIPKKTINNCMSKGVPCTKAIKNRLIP